MPLARKQKTGVDDTLLSTPVNNKNQDNQNGNEKAKKRGKKEQTNITDANEMAHFLSSPVGCFDNKKNSSDESSEEEHNKNETSIANKPDITLPSFFKKTMTADLPPEHERSNELIMWLLCKNHQTAAIAFTFQHAESKLTVSNWAQYCFQEHVLRITPRKAINHPIHKAFNLHDYKY